MNQSQLFSSGIGLAPFVTSSILLRKSWDVISSSLSGIIPNVGEGLSWNVYQEPNSELTIVAFEVKQDASKLHVDLVPSSVLKEKNFLHFEFLCTTNNPLFSINTTALSLFYDNRDKLDQLKSVVSSSNQLIVTGLALGGPIASLFTLSLLNGIDSGKKRPLCITFGSPLVGDNKLQEAVSRSPTWSSCFIHVFSYKDPLPKAFNPHTNAYMPFGTFLFCSDTHSTCFDNPESILELLASSIHVQNQGFQSMNYGQIVKTLYRRAVCKDTNAVRAEDLTHSDSLHASIILQLSALGLTPLMQQQQNIDINILATRLRELEKNFIDNRRVKFDPSRKLNEVKVYMAQLEWYKKQTKNEQIGYYDSYKNMASTREYVVVEFQKKLTVYWEKMVEEAEMKPQKEGAKFRTRWLGSGTTYRRMVEPLAIAQYYKEGGKDYAKTENRSKHFVQLEQWLEEGTTKAKSDLISQNKKNVEAMLTIDSCFWARVEEALLFCKELKIVKENIETSNKLLEFEEYVYGLLKNYAVSPEIFLAQSSYMRWWNEYRAIKGLLYNSPLTSFMDDASKHWQYARGEYNFP